MAHRRPRSCSASSIITASQSRIYIPDRIFEGYGPNAAAIELLVKEGANLIVTVDCGTTSFEPLAAAARLSTDVIVIDHHQADAELPKVLAVVNPNRQDDLSWARSFVRGGRGVSGAGRDLPRTAPKRGAYGGNLAEPNLLSLLDIVALATVADVVPLTGLNRAFVTKGLSVMHQRQNVGLRALFDVAALNAAPNPYALGFVLGPRINAGGRIGDAALGARLLATEDEGEAAKIAATLDRLNRERKALETQMLEEALAEADRRIDEAPEIAMLITGSESWHKGVVGLVASRLVERFRRPACAIAWEKQGEGTGSLRSVAGVDIGGAVRAAVAKGLLVKGGGHAMAAGLTVKRERLAELEAFMAERLTAASSLARSEASLEIDGALTPGGVNDNLMDLIEKVGPYGQGNPAPRFAFPAHRVKFAKVVGDAHIRCVLEAGDGSRLDAVAFRAKGQPLGDLLTTPGGMPHAHRRHRLKRDTWGGRQKIELTIEDAADPRRQ